MGSPHDCAHKLPPNPQGIQTSMPPQHLESICAKHALPQPAPHSLTPTPQSGILTSLEGHHHAPRSHTESSSAIHADPAQRPNPTLWLVPGMHVSCPPTELSKHSEPCESQIPHLRMCLLPDTCLEPPSVSLPLSPLLPAAPDGEKLTHWQPHSWLLLNEAIAFLLLQSL